MIHGRYLDETNLAACEFRFYTSHLVYMTKLERDDAHRESWYRVSNKKMTQEEANTLIAELKIKGWRKG